LLTQSVRLSVTHYDQFGWCYMTVVCTVSFTIIRQWVLSHISEDISSVAMFLLLHYDINTRKIYHLRVCRPRMYCTWVYIFKIIFCDLFKYFWIFRRENCTSGDDICTWEELKPSLIQVIQNIDLTLMFIFVVLRK
jgi:hypothetical protein